MIDSKSPLFFAFFLALGLAIPVSIVLSLDANFEIIHFALILFCMFSGYHLSRNLANSRVDLFDFVVWLFSYVWMGIAPLTQFSLGIFPTTTPDVNPDLAPASVAVVSLGLIAYLVARSRALTNRGFPTVNNFSLYSSRRRRSMEFVLWIVSCSSLVIYLSLVGFQALFTFRIERALLLASILEQSVTTELSYAICWTFSLIATTSAIKSLPDRIQLIHLIRVGLYAAPALLIANPISTGRYIFGCVYGAIFLQAVFSRLKFRPIWIKLMIVTGVTFLFPALNAFRTSESVGNNLVQGQYLTTGDFDAFTQVVNSLEVSLRQGFTLSNQFLGPLGFFIPRSIWPDKPLDTGRLIGNAKGYSFTNLSAPLWSEALISFTFIGVILSFVILGFLSTRADQKFAWAHRSEASALYFPGALYLVIMLRGSLLQAAMAFFLLLLASWIVSSHSKKDSWLPERKNDNQISF